MHSILALDVGFSNTGWTVWQGDLPIKCGVLKTEKQAKKRQVRKADDNALRAAIMARGLVEIMEANNVSAVVGELPSGGAQSATAMRDMAIATAVVSAVLEIKSMPSEWTTPNDVKMALCGTKTASKKDMMAAATRLYGRSVAFPKAESTFEHIADSIGAYLALRSRNLIKIFMAA